MYVVIINDTCISYNFFTVIMIFIFGGIVCLKIMSGACFGYVYWDRELLINEFWYLGIIIPYTVEDESLTFIVAINEVLLILYSSIFGVPFVRSSSCVIML